LRVTSDEGYAVLELSPGAPLSEVKQAYRELAKIWHPDLYPYDEALRARCEKTMQRINEAYEVLRREAPKSGPSSAAQAPSPASRPPSTEKVPAWDGRIRVREAGAEPPPPANAWKPFRRHVQDDRSDSAGLAQTFAAFTAAAAAMVSLFVIDNPTSTGYYLVVRTLVSGASLYGGYFALSRGYWESAAALAVLALFLNPIVPIPMSVEDWKLFNAACPVLLLFFWFHMYDRESSRG